MRKSKLYVGIPVILLVLIGFFVCVCTAETGSESNIYKVSPEGEFSIEFNIEPDNTEVYAFQYNIIFDPEYLNVIYQEEGSLLNADDANTSVVANKIDNIAGKAEFACTRVGVPSGVKTPGTAAIINLKSTGIVGNTWVEITNIKIVNVDNGSLESIDMQLIRWDVEITPEDPSSANNGNLQKVSPGLIAIVLLAIVLLLVGVHLYARNRRD